MQPGRSMQAAACSAACLGCQGAGHLPCSFRRLGVFHSKEEKHGVQVAHVPVGVCVCVVGVCVCVLGGSTCVRRRGRVPTMGVWVRGWGRHERKKRVCQEARALLGCARPARVCKPTQTSQAACKAARRHCTLSPPPIRPHAPHPTTLIHYTHHTHRTPHIPHSHPPHPTSPHHTHSTHGIDHTHRTHHTHPNNPGSRYSSHSLW